MLTFRDLREKKLKSMPPGEHIWNKKIKGVSAMVHKDKNKYVLYIDNERLDEYPTIARAKMSAGAFIKAAKKEIK
jgi:hypothetical protein